MNILFLVHRIPYPPNKGDKIRSWNELRFLAKRHAVYLGCLVDDPRDLQYVDNLRSIVADVHVEPLVRSRAVMRAGWELFRGGCLSNGYFYVSSLQQWVNATLRQRDIDCVLLFSSPMMAYMQDPEVPVVMDFCDVDSAKWAQYAERGGVLRRALYRLEAQRLAGVERQILQSCAHAVLVTEQERQLWAGLEPGLRSKVHVIPNGVDVTFFAPDVLAPPPRREPYAMVFTGAMDYYANVDGVRWFVHEVFPRIRAAIPEAVFYIVGSRPSPEVRALESHQGVVVTGFVDDIREYYARASLAVVPLRIARGIQNKVLEAMAMGLPVIASEPAYEGLGAARDEDIVVAADAAGFATQAVELLQDEARRRALGAAGRGFVEQHYVWGRSMADLESLLEDAATRGARAPQMAG